MDYIKQLEARGITGRILGNNLMISCPFHNDNNPSMGVHIHKGVFQCNSGVCGETGNFTKLIAHLDNISYEEARLALQSQISMKETVREIEDLLSSSPEVYRQKPLSRKKFHQRFPPVETDPDQLAYLYGPDRKLSNSIIRAFDLRAGRSIKIRTTKWNSRWYRRVLIPIYDHKGRLLTFTGRSIEDKDSPFFRKTVKYGAKKEAVLFGLYQLLQASSYFPYLVIVEGEFDAIYLQQFGIPAVATMGTSGLTPPQIQLLMRCTDVVFICFDGDRAGRVASKKELDKVAFTTAYRLKLPRGKDPNKLSEREVYRYVQLPIREFMKALRASERARKRSTISVV